MSKTNSVYRVEYGSDVVHYLIPGDAKEKDELLLKSYTSGKKITVQEFRDNGGRIVFDCSIDVNSFHDIENLNILSRRGAIESPLELKLLCFNEDP